jgi:IS30 family transposase
MYSKYPNTGTNIKFLYILVDNWRYMANGLTIAEMAIELNRKTDTVKRQLQRKGIRPTAYAGPTALYEHSALDAIRNVPGKGRPKKQPEKP